MNISRDTVELGCNFEKAFSAIRNLSLKGFKVVKVDEPNKLITVRTPMSAFSWGENVELLVVPSTQGCVISFRSSSRHPLNISSDTKTPIDGLVRYLQSIC